MGTRIRKFIEYLKKCTLSIIYPMSMKCLCCEDELDELKEDNVCIKCEKKISKYKSCIKNIINDVEIYSCAHYSYTIKQLVFNLKYKNDFNSGEYLVKLLLEKFIEIGFEVNYITYVPSSKRTLNNRGFDQCEFLAKKLAEKVEIPVINTLKKSNKVKEQKTLGFEERRDNIKNAFTLNEGLNLKGSSILLIDDIITTGATLNSCVIELKKYEAIRIFILTIGNSHI